MELSFKEKSLWVMFVGVTGAFAFYFASVLPAPVDQVLPQQVGVFFVAVVGLVLVQIIGHALAAIGGHAEEDERDRLIQLKGARNAGLVLGVGVFFAQSAALVTPGNFIFTHVLLAFWVLSELVEIGSQLYLHRRGA